jgi:ribose transport system permease protein
MMNSAVVEVGGARLAGKRSVALLAQFGLLFVFGLLIILFTWKSDTFLTADTFRTIINIEIAPMLIFAMGLTVVLVMGDFDLSFAATAGVAAYTISAMVVTQGQSWVIGVLLAILTGLIVGSVNGYLVAYRKTSSFVITLAMSTLLYGFEQIWSDQKVIQGVEDQAFLNLNSLTGLWNIRVGVFIAIAVAVLAWILLEKTESGTSIPRQFDGLLLPAYASVFLGASVFKPGKFNVAGTVVGCLFLRTIKVGLLSWGLDTAWINITQGTILIFAVLLGKLVDQKS